MVSPAALIAEQERVLVVVLPGLSPAGFSAKVVSAVIDQVSGFMSSQIRLSLFERQNRIANLMPDASDIRRRTCKLLLCMKLKHLYCSVTLSQAPDRLTQPDHICDLIDIELAEFHEEK